VTAMTLDGRDAGRVVEPDDLSMDAIRDGALAGRPVTVLGLARSGVAAARFLADAGAIVTIYGLANTVVRVLGSRSTIGFTRKDYVDVELRVPSVGKAAEILGFEARIDLEEGIRRSADHYRGRPA